MGSHPFDTDFLITPERKEQFRRDGFVKLKGFLNAEVVEALLERIEVEMGRGAPSNFKDEKLFTRAKYDFETDKPEVYELMEWPHFRRTLTDLSECDLFLITELCFEIEST